MQKVEKSVNAHHLQAFLFLMVPEPGSIYFGGVPDLCDMRCPNPIYFLLVAFKALHRVGCRGFDELCAYRNHSN